MDARHGLREAIDTDYPGRLPQKEIYGAALTKAR